MKTRTSAVIGLEERGEKRGSRSAPPKTAFPNPKLARSYPERTSNMLKNLERSHWITSYQLQYTGKEAGSGTNVRSLFLSLTFCMNVVYFFFKFVTNIYSRFAGLGPASPLKMDDLSEKVIDHARMNSCSALLVKPNNEHVVLINVPSVHH